MTAEGALELAVGTYARRGGRGLRRLRYELGANRLSVLDDVHHIGDASFGLWSARHGCFYLVDEAQGLIGAYDPHAEWRCRGQVATGGEAPCHVAIDDDQQRLAVANYESGSVALFTLDADGGLGAPELHRLSGNGPGAERQRGPHAHWVGFDGDDLLAVDLGADRILRFPAHDGLGEPQTIFAAPAGSGPRHLARGAGGRLLLVSELASTLTLLEPQRESLVARQTLSTQAAPRAGGNLGGAIATNAAGDRIFVTNRGDDSIAAFALSGGRLALRGRVPSGGASPRFLLLLEEAGRLLVANEEGGTVAAFRLDGDGVPEPDGASVEAPGAVFIAVVPEAGDTRS